jgi:Rne/Rng family ribonuclease
VEQYQRIVEFLDKIQPALVSRVRLYRREEPIFDEFGIEPEIERALKSKVWLKSGGYIVINQTEALVAIDVNTGKYVGKKNLEETVFRTNLEAVREIVRQIRLRDLGGIIVSTSSTWRRRPTATRSTRPSSPRSARTGRKRRSSRSPSSA